MSVEIDRLTTEVKENADAVDSAITLLTTLSDLIIANKNEPGKLQALADELDAKSKKLAEAVLANTPAAEPPPVEPPPVEPSGRTR